MCIRNTNLVSYDVIKLFMISDAAKDEAKEELEVLDESNSGGMGTGSAITAIGAGVFIFFIAACCIVLCCKYK